MATKGNNKFRQMSGLDDDPDEYGSVRPEGFSKELDRLKDMRNERAKNAVISTAKGTAKSMIPGVGTAMAGEDMANTGREIEMANRLHGLKEAMRSSADREMSNQTRRESRGVKETQEDLGSAMKKGGMTASKRADGIAQRGKTRGKMIMCGGGRT